MAGEKEDFPSGIPRNSGVVVRSPGDQTVWHRGSFLSEISFPKESPDGTGSLPNKFPPGNSLTNMPVGKFRFFLESEIFRGWPGQKGRTAGLTRGVPEYSVSSD